MMKRFLRGCGRFSCHHYRLVLVLAILLTIISLIPPMMAGAKTHVSVASMMPKEIPAAKSFTRALEDFGTADEVFIIFRAKRAADADAIGKYMIMLEEDLTADPEFQDAYCRYMREEDKGFLEREILRRGLLYLPPEGIREIAEQLSDKKIGRNIRQTRNKLSALAGSDSDKLILLNALNIFPTFKKYLAGAYSNVGSENSGSFMARPDGDGMFMLLAAQPYGPAQRLEYSCRIMDLVREKTNAVLDKMPPALREGVVVEYAGGYEVATRYRYHVQDSLFWTLLTSLIGVLILFGYCYRRYGVLFYVGIPLVMIVCWTVGAGWLMFGKLNMISCAFAAVLIGLGVDYAIHIYNRYIEERAKGREVELSFVNAISHTGSGVVVGMLTTAFSFFALMVTKFSGLAQFGVLAGTGLALALPGMAFVLPALIVWRSKRGGGEHPRALRSVNFGLPALAGFVERNDKLVAGIGISLAVLSAVYIIFGGNGLVFDERLASLRPSDDRVFELGKEISEKFTKKSAGRLMLLSTGATEAEAMNNSRGVLPKLTELKDQGMLKDFELITQFVPAPLDQVERREEIRKIDFNHALEVLQTRLDKENLDPAAFNQSFDFLKNHAKLAKSEETILPTDFIGTPAWRLIRRLVAQRKIGIKVKYAQQELDKQGELTLATVPTSRDGVRYFTKDFPITVDALAYLDKAGISTIPVTTRGSTEEPKEENVHQLLEKQVRPTKSFFGKLLGMLNLAGESEQTFVGNLVYAADIHTPQGGPIMERGTKMTPELIEYLRKDDCRSINCFREGWTVQGAIYPPQSESEALEFSDKWVNSIRDTLGIDPNADPDKTDSSLFLTGSMLAAHDLATIVKNDFFKISIYVAAIAALVLTVCYRDPAKVFLSLVPIILAIVYLLGIMSLGRIYFNFINVLVIPIIIGLGVDNGIHLVHRFYESGKGIKPVVVETGRAIVITNLTSMVGFGSLWAGSYTGLTSMGMLSVLGLSLSLVSAIIILPAILHLLVGRRKQQEANDMEPEQTVN